MKDVTTGKFISKKDNDDSTYESHESNFNKYSEESDSDEYLEQ